MEEIWLWLFQAERIPFQKCSSSQLFTASALPFFNKAILLFEPKIIAINEALLFGLKPTVSETSTYNLFRFSLLIKRRYKSNSSKAESLRAWYKKNIPIGSKTALAIHMPWPTGSKPSRPHFSPRMEIT